MKKLFITAVIICIALNLHAQGQNKPGQPIGGIIVKGGRNPGGNIYLNANTGSSSSPGIATTHSFNPSIGVELFWGHIGAGLDIGTFQSNPNFDIGNYVKPLKNLDFLNISNNRACWRSTYFLVGPQYSLSKKVGRPKYANKESEGRHTPFHNKIDLTASVKGGVTNNKAPDLIITDNSSTPTKNIAAYKQSSDFKQNAFTLKPAIHFAYWLSKSVALTANAQYLAQLGQKEFATNYRDVTRVNFSGPSSEQQRQIATAPAITTATTGPDRYFSYGAGLSFQFRKGWDGVVKGGSKNSRKGINQAGIKKNTVEMQVLPTNKGIQENGKNITVTVLGTGETTADGIPIIEGKTVSGTIGGGAASASYAATGIVIKQPESGDVGNTLTDRKGNFSITLGKDTTHYIYINGNEYGKIKLTDTENPTVFLNSLFIKNKDSVPVLNPSVFKQVTKDIELQGMKIYFKKDHKIYKYLGDENRIVKILQDSNPQNKTKECDNCTTRTCNGTVYNCSCYNGFCYCMLCIDITKLDDLE